MKYVRKYSGFTLLFGEDVMSSIHRFMLRLFFTSSGHCVLSMKQRTTLKVSRDDFYKDIAVP